MKYFKNTMDYMRRNFPKLLLFSIIPAIVFTFTGNIWKTVSFFANPEAITKGFSHIYSHFSFIFGESILLGILGFFVVSFFASLTFSAIERHMKIGKFSISKPFSRVDESIMAVMPVYFFFVLGLELLALLNTVFIVAFAAISVTVGFVVAHISTAIIFSVAILLSIQILFWIPAMSVLGYPLKSALLFSMKALSGKSKKIFGLFFTIIALSILITGVSFVYLFEFLGPFAGAINFIFYILLFMFFISYSMVSFFDTAEEPRNDTNKFKKNYLT